MKCNRKQYKNWMQSTGKKAANTLKPIVRRSKSFSDIYFRVTASDHTKPWKYLPINNRLVQLNVTMGERSQIWSSNLLITTNHDKP